jgi:hypothetical protein
MADKEMIQEKIGEAIGLEKAAQKAVEELDSRGLLKPEHMNKLTKMKQQAGEQEQRMEEPGNYQYRISDTKYAYSKRCELAATTPHYQILLTFHLLPLLRLYESL